MTDQTLADLAAQQAQTAQDLRELAGDVAEIGGMVHTTADRSTRLERALDMLANQVEEVARELGTDPDSADEGLTPIAWHTLNQSKARAAWEELLNWADTVLCPTYGITRGQLPDCWTRHPAMRNEISWLRTCHIQAYHPDAHAGGAAEWHLRYLPGALERIAGHAQGWGQVDDEKPSSCLKGTCRQGPLPHPWQRRGTAFELARHEVWDLEAVQRDIDSRPASQKG